MMSRILFWLVLKPLSLLPFWMLYGISDFFCFVIYRIVGYRKAVVFDNLRQCFPEKSEAEIQSIARKFYHHLCDLIIESIKNFSISEKELRKRMLTQNAELFAKYFKEGRSIILCGGHYGNWEMWALSAPLYLEHKILGIYKKLKDPYFDEKMRLTRGRFGLKLISTRDINEYLKTNTSELNVTVLAVDQSPSDPKKCVWVNFLGRETAALYGSEKFAKEYNRPVIYGHVEKIKRGYYRMHYELIVAEPGEMAYGEIIQKAHDILEREILRAPEFWLWSHKRWKHKRPKNDFFEGSGS
jgi:Kdo2-lipid IVA lauroyltransferase/acyltransferase